MAILGMIEVATINRNIHENIFKSIDRDQIISNIESPIV